MITDKNIEAWRDKLMRDLISLNKQRESAYIRIKHIIDSCTNYAQLQQCSTMVNTFCDKGGGDAAYLRSHYSAALIALNPDPEKKQDSTADEMDIVRIFGSNFKIG